MLNTEQRDHLIELFEKEEDKGVKMLIQNFSDMHNSFKEADPVVTDMSVDIFDMSLEAHRLGRDDVASALSNMAGTIMKADMLAVTNELMFKVQAGLAILAGMGVAGVVVKPKKKKKKGGADASAKE